MYLLVVMCCYALNIIKLIGSVSLYFIVWCIWLVFFHDSWVIIRIEATFLLLVCVVVVGLHQDNLHRYQMLEKQVNMIIYGLTHYQESEEKNCLNMKIVNIFFLVRLVTKHWLATRTWYKYAFPSTEKRRSFK